jgi:hypothetical protein
VSDIGDTLRNASTKHTITVSSTGFECSCGAPALSARPLKSLLLNVTIDVDGQEADDLAALLAGDRWWPTATALRHQFHAMLQEPINAARAGILTNCLRCNRESFLASTASETAVIAFLGQLRVPCSSCGKTPIEIAAIES